MGSRLQVEGDESVLLRVTHSNLKSFSADVRFSLQMTVESVKEKLWKKCGTSVNSMCLELYDDADAKISDLSDNLRPLGFYSPQDGYRLHVIDLDPSSVTSGGWLEDTSLVEKYSISDEVYDKLDGTFRKFKERLVSQNPSALQTKIPENYMEELCTNIKVGDRCEVEPGEKRGVIKFVGRAESIAPGFWVGVQYDEPLGKHDGMVKGTRLFDCPPLHGALVRPDKVKVCLQSCFGCHLILKLLQDDGSHFSCICGESYRLMPSIETRDPLQYPNLSVSFSGPGRVG
ncbi:hypothetical protein L1049_007899 [Liquidambar formosana]|uniref:CAP-Gly domain-containing protein n=1 Tax=Liquidambar formosana TaxID=63359 RepID=A0AAP0S2R6_LIQFO